MFQSAPPTEVRGDRAQGMGNRAVDKFQSAPPTEVRGDAGYSNQRNTKGLDGWMRDSIEWMTRISDSRIDERANLLLYIRFRIARNLRPNAITLPSRTLKDQRTGQIHRFANSVMLRLLSGVFTQMIKPERILLEIDFPQQTISELRPFCLSHLTFKKRFLNPNTVILTGPCDSAQPPLPGPVGRGNVICDEHEHDAVPTATRNTGLLWDERDIVGDIAAEFSGQQLGLNAEHLP